MAPSAAVDIVLKYCKNNYYDNTFLDTAYVKKGKKTIEYNDSTVHSNFELKKHERYISV